MKEGTLKPSALAAPRLSARTLVYYRDLILVLLAKEFKIRYKSTFVGYAWSLLHPLVLALIFFNVFRLVIRGVPDYALYLIAGLFPWQCVSNVCLGSNYYFLGNSSLIKKVRFQRAMLVVAGVLNELVHLVISLPVIVAFMLYYGRKPELDWLWLVPALLAVQAGMLTGVALTVATSNLFFRDLERLVGLGTQLLFYLTPIVYPLDLVPPDYTWILYANPFASLILCWQGLFYSGRVPLACLSLALAWSLGLLTLGLVVYGKKVWRFAEIV